jgi:hypothetical protein
MEIYTFLYRIFVNGVSTQPYDEYSRSSYLVIPTIKITAPEYFRLKTR